jgi:hypothetical protein
MFSNSFIPIGMVLNLSSLFKEATISFKSKLEDSEAMISLIYFPLTIFTVANNHVIIIDK